MPITLPRFRFRVHLPAIRSRAVLVCLLALWSGWLFLYGIGTNTLYRTESLRAMIGRETLQGNWLIPTLYGEPFLTKPPGMYVAIALCSWPVGEVTEFTARLPSVLAGLVSVVAFFSLLRRAVEFEIAWLLSMVLPVSLLWLDKVPSAEIDMLQVMWVLLAIVCFARAVEGKSRSIGWWIAAMLCTTAGFLTKWTAPAFFYLTAVPYLIWNRRLSLFLSWGHLIGVGISILLVGGWVVAVSASVGWELLFETVKREALQRLGSNGAGKGFPWLSALLFPPLVIATNFPWSFLAILSLRSRFRNALSPSERMLWKLGHCWVWPNLLFWSMTSQHIVRYVFPISPGFALLGSMTLIAWCRTRCSESDGCARTPMYPWVKLRQVVLAGCIVWGIVKIVSNEFIFPERTRHRHVREIATELRLLLPDGEILYHAKLKDEGLMYYFDRPSRKFEPGARHGIHALLIESEWAERTRFGTVREIAWLKDQQGDPIVLVSISEPPHERHAP